MNQVTKPQLCVMLKTGIQLWIDADKRKLLVEYLKEKEFVDVDGQLVSRYEIAGVFTPDRVDEYTKRKNGMWKCQHGTWHERYTKCHCEDPNQSETITAKIEGTDQVITYKRPRRPKNSSKTKANSSETR